MEEREANKPLNSLTFIAFVDDSQLGEGAKKTEIKTNKC